MADDLPDEFPFPKGSLGAGQPRQQGRRITFVFEGTPYGVGLEACDKNLPIKLPDGRVLRVVGGWLESMPPQPAKLEILECAEAIKLG